ncbi:MAG: hemolysin family protein [Fervidobacterium sp.]|uniref:hemolysin family protein n=1 Tax=Fervidobacterium sp. TaxID=1871331 RepID=UPI004048FC84
MEDPLSYLWNVFAIAILIFLSGFFSASETAMTSVSRHRLRMLAKSKQEEEEETEVHFFNKLLTTLLISNNLVNILASTLAAMMFSKLITSGSVSALVSTVVMTFLLLVFGEITPKIIARQNSEKLFDFSIKVIIFLSKIFAPVITLFIRISNAFVRVLGGQSVQEAPFITMDDIASYLEMGREEGTITHEEGLMIERTIEMDETLVKEIMIPRIDVVAVEESQSLKEFIELIVEEEYSRFPVYRETIDNIVGVCYAKDVLSFIAQRGMEIIDKVSVKELMRPPLFVPELMPVSELLKEFKTKKVHMAIVVDEYGGTSGIVTMEDILEEIFGEIMDEYDDHESSGIKRIDDNSYLVDATISLNDIERELRIEFPEGEFETLAGYLLDKFRHIPKVGEMYEYDGITFKIVASSRNKIEKVLLTIKKEQVQEEKEDEN